MKKNNLTGSYAAVQGLFWMVFSIAVNYAAVYLQGFGYSNTTIGIIVAAGNILGVLLGPEAVSLSQTKIRPSTLLYAVMGIQSLSLLLMRVINRQSLFLSVCFVVFLALRMAMNSVLLSLYTICSQKGIPLDYTFCRGTGSAGFVVISASLGVLTEKTNPDIIPVVGLMLILIEFIINGSFIKKMKELEAFGGNDRQTEPENTAGSTSLIAFFSGNRRYSLMLLFSVLIFIGHNSVYNFYINVVRNVGGNASMMGLITGYMGLVEVPIMMLYGKFSKGRDRFFLSFAFLFFSAKAVAFALAGTMTQLFMAQTLQMFSYAFYACAIVPYSEKVLSASDAAKGQSLAYSMTVVGSVLASFTAGPLYDRVTVRTVLWITVAFCAAGSAGCFLCINGGCKNGLKNRKIRLTNSSDTQSDNGH